MAAPEAPLRYVGVPRESAAFRLMKQMVLTLFSMQKYVQLFRFMYFLKCVIYCVFGCVFRDGKKAKDLGRISKE